MNKEGELKITEPKEEPQEEFKRNEMGYKTWFDNNSEGGSIAVNNSNEIKQQQNIEQTQVEKKKNKDMVIMLMMSGLLDIRNQI